MRRTLLTLVLAGMVVGCSSSAKTTNNDTPGFFNTPSPSRTQSSTPTPTPTPSPTAKPSYATPFGSGKVVGTGSDLKTYTVQPGDWVSKISAKTGASWDAIYNKNAAIIESTAIENHMPNSDHGHWIYSGETLVIP